MRTSSSTKVAGNSKYTEEKPPLYTAFAMATKRPVNETRTDKDEELYEGAD